MQQVQSNNGSTEDVWARPSWDRGPREVTNSLARRILYLDPWAGLAGDMILAALVDAAEDREQAALLLQDVVASLRLPGVAVEVSRGQEWGLACTRVKVREEVGPPPRGLSELLEIVAGSSLQAAVRERAARAITRLVDVEAEVHGQSRETVHLHEVGAADTLVDVVGTFALIDAWGIERVHVGEIPLGGGSVDIGHGRVKVPAPATASLLMGYQVRGGSEARELTTPTGALLLRELGAVQGPLPSFELQRVGYGAGWMQLASGPNLLRALVGVEAEVCSGPPASLPGAKVDSVVELVTNLDDVSPEVIGYTVGRLRESGALEVWTAPVQMKKGRPGVLLHVLVAPDNVEEAAAVIFEETGTLGVRSQTWVRHVLERGWETVELSGGRVRVKWGRRGRRLVSLAPEFEEAAEVAARSGMPLRTVMEHALQAARAKLKDGGEARRMKGD